MYSFGNLDFHLVCILYILWNLQAAAMVLAAADEITETTECSHSQFALRVLSDWVGAHSSVLNLWRPNSKQVVEIDLFIVI